MLVQCKKPMEYKENVIYFITFDFGEDVTIIYWMENMNIYA